ncbi:hypothetical protein MRB53_041145 [Persea americana]|nr:hypothetical protein MRB53_041145 [Persea americana]
MDSCSCTKFFLLLKCRAQPGFKMMFCLAVAPVKSRCALPSEIPVAQIDSKKEGKNEKAAVVSDVELVIGARV